jgi:peptidoglycan hydrolase CwlO-like protein
MFDNLGFWSLGLNLLVLIVSISGFVKITRNDLVHLEKDVKEIKNTLSNIDKKLDNTTERIAKIEGKCTANHGI